MSTAQYRDDETIGRGDPLWRRIPPWHVVDNGVGGFRISSAAFDDDTDGHPMSVILGAEVQRAKRDPRSCLEGCAQFGLASITAGFARDLGQGVQRNPLEVEPAHALAFGRKTKSVRKQFATAATNAWVIKPPAEVIDACLGR
jgi:hypothetical protein